MSGAVHRLFGAPNTKARRFMLIATSIAIILMVGMALGRADASTNLEAAAIAVFALVPVFLAVELAHRATERHRGQFDVVEHVVIASDDAYDYADQLDDGETVLEDKRTGECYLAERRGGADA